MPQSSPRSGGSAERNVMRAMNEDLTNKLLKGCSPYINSAIYDIDKRELSIECVDNPETRNPKKQMIFSGILRYKEENIEEKPDDNLLDSIIGINWVRKGILCIHTEKKEIILELENEPLSHDIA